ncbi:zinc metalloprotease mde10 [Xylariaceae sp. FL0016]|nr:zinc metalloprotease mde10 [Xylariaceae sp. FL0016]
MMRSILRAAATILLTLSHSSEAHSVQRNPLSYISRVDNPILHTPSHRVHAHSSFDLSFLLHDEQDKIRIALEPNHDVLSNNAVISYLGPDGTVTREEKIDRSEHRVYRGHTFVQHPHHHEWINAGWARITVHRDGLNPIFEGTFRVNGNQHHLQSSRTYRQTRLAEDPEAWEADDEYMIVWRTTDVISNTYDNGRELKRGLGANASVCSSDLLDFNSENNHPIHRGLDVRELFTRDSIDGGTTGSSGATVDLSSTIGSTAGCPTTRKVALIGIATDCTYTEALGSKEEARSNIISMVNSASQLYESTFNISIGIQNLTISEAQCPGTPSASSEWNQDCSDSVTITDRLVMFSEWRGQFIDSNAYWTLLSTCNTDAAVGLAWLGQLCAQGSSPNGNETTAGANVVVRTNTEWQVFAHESGHTFGAYHDCIDTTCSDGTFTMQKCCPLTSSTCDADGQFIMNPSTSPGIDTFSPCTIGNICSSMERNSVNSQCLSDNKNVVTITGSQCGNGIVEAGEECDCGGDSGCANNACCDADTCKFTTNSVCDPANEECCTDSCQFKASNIVCRASTGSCDPQEVCTGTDAMCPADTKASDGTSCGSSGDGLTCASGQCTSRDLQCQNLVGTLTNNNSTSACDSQTCQVRCASSKLGPNACYDMQQYFLDGTPCEGGGHCDNGQCKGANFTDQVGSWISDNKNIVIPVAAVVGGLLVIAIASCCLSCIRRRMRRKKLARKAQPNSSWVGGNAWQAEAIAPPPVASGANGSGRRSRQRAPPDSWQEDHGWRPPRMPSTRYA